MKTIGIELNHVIRNINKQLLKYYSRDINPSLDIDGIDEHDNVLGKYIKFDNISDKNNFIYIDYPFEIFGCAPIAEKNLNAMLTMWIENLSNVEDDDFNVMFFSLDENEISIQSTYFFLSKIGSRVRKVVFPTNDSDVWNECDVVITANRALIESEKPSDKKIIMIERNFNQDLKDKADAVYDNLSSLLNDDDFFKKILSSAQDK